MRKFISDFIHRGLVACGFGPITLAIVYAILKQCSVLHTITVNEVILGILTSALLAFIAGGINAIYKIERLPLMLAIFIHAVILYLDYVVIYLANDWMKSELIPLLVFTSCYVFGFAVIWVIVYFYTKNSTDKLNKKLMEHQKRAEKTKTEE